MTSADSGGRRPGFPGPGRKPGRDQAEGYGTGPGRRPIRGRPDAAWQRQFRQRLEAHWGWTIRPHAADRAAELGFTLGEILRCAVEPSQTYCAGPGHPPEYRVHQLDDVAIVVHPGKREVVTVLLRTTRRWEHGRDHRGTV